MLHYLILDLLIMSYYNRFISLHTNIITAEELDGLGTIICKDCHEIINHYEEEKVTTLYATCPNCNTQTK